MSKPYGHINSKHSVCMNCGDRRIGCHGICKDYIEEVENANKEKEKKRKGKERKGKERKGKERKGNFMKLHLHYIIWIVQSHIEDQKIHHKEVI